MGDRDFGLPGGLFYLSQHYLRALMAASTVAKR